MVVLRQIELAKLSIDDFDVIYLDRAFFKVRETVFDRMHLHMAF